MRIEIPWLYVLLHPCDTWPCRRLHHLCSWPVTIMASKQAGKLLVPAFLGCMLKWNRPSSFTNLELTTNTFGNSQWPWFHSVSSNQCSPIFQYTIKHYYYYCFMIYFSGILLWRPCFLPCMTQLRRMSHMSGLIQNEFENGMIVNRIILFTGRKVWALIIIRYCPFVKA